jgi:hypothetical protein
MNGDKKMTDKSNNSPLLRILSASGQDSTKIAIVVLVVIFAFMVDICVSNSAEQERQRSLLN